MNDYQTKQFTFNPANVKATDQDGWNPLTFVQNGPQTTFSLSPGLYEVIATFPDMDQVMSGGVYVKSTNPGALIDIMTVNAYTNNRNSATYKAAGAGQGWPENGVYVFSPAGSLWVPFNNTEFNYMVSLEGRQAIYLKIFTDSQIEVLISGGRNFRAMAYRKIYQ